MRVRLEEWGEWVVELNRRDMKAAAKTHILARHPELTDCKVRDFGIAGQMCYVRVTAIGQSNHQTK